MMKKLRVDFQTMSLIDEAIEHKANTQLNAGDKVYIDAEAIMSKPHFENMQPAYKEFIENSVNRVFTVEKEEKYIGKPIVSLVEDPSEVKWLFFEGDLIKYKETDEDVQDD